MGGVVMERRWLLLGGTTAVAVLVAASVWWATARQSDDDPEFVATLTSMGAREVPHYAHPEWWSDGTTPLRLGWDGESLVVDSPRPNIERLRGTRLDTALAVPSTADPATVAALPGGEGAPWIAVAFESKRVDQDDKETVESPLTWAGSEVTSGERLDGGAATTMPVTLRSNEISPAEGPSAIMTADAAVARLGDTDTALVTTSQLGTITLHRCTLSACEGEEAAGPDGETPFSIASTGDGFVTATGARDEGHTIWYAGDDELQWQAIGEIPEGETLSALRDGEKGVIALTQGGSDDETAYGIRTVDAGGVEQVVEPTLFSGSGQVTAVGRNGEDWFLAGFRASDTRVDFDPQSTSAELWTLGDEEWEPLGDPLLEYQPLQWIQVLFTSLDGELAAVSNAPGPDITMTWSFATVED